MSTSFANITDTTELWSLTIDQVVSYLKCQDTIIPDRKRKARELINKKYKQLKDKQLPGCIKVELLKQAICEIAQILDVEGAMRYNFRNRTSNWTRDDINGLGFIASALSACKVVDDIEVQNRLIFNLTTKDWHCF